MKSRKLSGCNAGAPALLLLNSGISVSVTSVRSIALKRRDRALEGFAQNPAIAVGKRVEPLDSIGSRLDVELDISTSAMPPWLARYRFPLRFLQCSRNRSGRGLERRPDRLAAHEVGSLRDCLHLVWLGGRLGCRSRIEPGDVNVGSVIEHTGALRTHHATSWTIDRKSTRLNSSHLVISYAVFCLKKSAGNTDRSRRAGARRRGGCGWTWRGPSASPRLRGPRRGSSWRRRPGPAGAACPGPAAAAAAWPGVPHPGRRPSRAWRRAGRGYLSRPVPSAAGSGTRRSPSGSGSCRS